MILYHVHCNYSKIPGNIGHRNSGADQVRKKDTDFSFYLVFVLAPFKLQAKAPFSQIRSVNQASTYSLWYQ